MAPTIDASLPANDGAAATPPGSLPLLSPQQHTSAQYDVKEEEEDEEGEDERAKNKQDQLVPPPSSAVQAAATSDAEGAASSVPSAVAVQEVGFSTFVTILL